MVLNHSVGPSSVETQAEVPLYIWIISLMRQLGILYWLRITGIDDLWRVSNAFQKSTKTSDAAMFVNLLVSIVHVNATTCSVVDLPAQKNTLALTELRINYWLQMANKDFVEQFCTRACLCDSSLIIECS